MKLAAEFADNFNVLGGSPQSFKERMETPTSFCRQIGRDPREVRRSWHGFVNITDERQTIEETVRNLKAMADAGVQDFVLGFRDQSDIKALRAFADDVLPLFR